jgi:dihydroorotate dehydrogenase
VIAGRRGGWRLRAYRAARPLLFTVEAERIHALTLAVLAAAGRGRTGRSLCALASGVATSRASRGAVEVMGLRFRNRVGLGAGFDKDAVALPGWAALGLGFVEVGTVTPRPQPGNPRPRLFRLARDHALINRMGFNNAGADAAAERIAEARAALPAGFVVGVNVGRNRDTPPELGVDDLVAAARATARHAGYLGLNVSSPNTPRLRELQAPQILGDLVERVADVADGRPILVKLDPDLGERRFDAALDSLARSPAAGVILSNTTLRRSGLRTAGPPLAEPGGLSGLPLRPRMLSRVRRARRLCGERLVIVASGGISSARDARDALRAGADLVQLWTGLVYAGPGLIGSAIRASSAG